MDKKLTNETFCANYKAIFRVIFYMSNRREGVIHHRQPDVAVPEKIMIEPALASEVEIKNVADRALGQKRILMSEYNQVVSAMGPVGRKNFLETVALFDQAYWELTGGVKVDAAGKSKLDTGGNKIPLSSMDKQRLITRMEVVIVSLSKRIAALKKNLPIAALSMSPKVGAAASFPKIDRFVQTPQQNLPPARPVVTRLFGGLLKKVAGVAALIGTLLNPTGNGVSQAGQSRGELTQASTRPALKAEGATFSLRDPMAGTEKNQNNFAWSDQPTTQSNDSFVYEPKARQDGREKLAESFSVEDRAAGLKFTQDTFATSPNVAKYSDGGQRIFASHAAMDTPGDLKVEASGHEPGKILASTFTSGSRDEWFNEQERSSATIAIGNVGDGQSGTSFTYRIDFTPGMRGVADLRINEDPARFAFRLVDGWKSKVKTGHDKQFLQTAQQLLAARAILKNGSLVPDKYRALQAHIATLESLVKSHLNNSANGGLDQLLK